MMQLPFSELRGNYPSLHCSHSAPDWQSPMGTTVRTIRTHSVNKAVPPLVAQEIGESTEGQNQRSGPNLVPASSLGSWKWIRNITAVTPVLKVTHMSKVVAGWVSGLCLAEEKLSQWKAGTQNLQQALNALNKEQKEIALFVCCPI